jgi:predicted DNA-binding helix-hairpin-helix protein
MEVARTLAILVDTAKYDASCASSGTRGERAAGGIGNATGTGVCHSCTPDGRCVSLREVLLTNYCILDCLYCVDRVSSDIPRARFTLPDVAGLTLDFHRRTEERWRTC